MTSSFDPDRYLVLRVDGAVPSGKSKLESMDALSPRGAVPAAPPRLTVEATALTDIQRRNVVEDSRQVAAPIIPMALVEPVATGDAQAAAALQAARETHASWGIEVVRAIHPFNPDRRSERDIAVAVLDTGIDRTHPAFSGIATWSTRNFINPAPDVAEDPDVKDGNGHGTHCASTIFGRNVEGVRIGVAPGVTSAVIAKVLDDRGRGSNEAVASALQWAAQKGARIISMSLGFDFTGMVDQLKAAAWTERAAVSKALQAYRDNVRYFDRLVEFLNFDGRLLIAAAGNESKRGVGGPDQLIDVSMPAATQNVISVGALRRAGASFAVAPFSNVNPVLSAPGVDIVGAKVGGGLVAMSGTSMACPHVAGLAALWWDSEIATKGQCAAEDVKAILRAGARPIELLRFADQGRGIAIGPES